MSGLLTKLHGTIATTLDPVRLANEANPVKKGNLIFIGSISLFVNIKKKISQVSLKKVNY